MFILEIHPVNGCTASKEMVVQPVPMVKLKKSLKQSNASMDIFFVFQGWNRSFELNNVC